MDLKAVFASLKSWLQRVPSGAEILEKQAKLSKTLADLMKEASSEAALNTATANRLAELIVSIAPTYGVDIALAAALLLRTDIAAVAKNRADPESEVIFICKSLEHNLKWAKSLLDTSKALASVIPYGDYRLLAVQAHISGRTGALDLTETKGRRSSKWAYAVGIVEQADSWKPLLAE